MYASAATTVFQSIQNDAHGFSAALDFALTADEIFDLYNNAPCGYHSLDANGLFLRVNNTELRWLGYTRDEIVGQLQFSDILTRESRLRFEASSSHFQEQGYLRDQEFQLIRKDGSIIDVLLNATAVYNDLGDLISSRASLFDITERKKSETALREREQLIHRILTATPDLIYVHDTEVGRNIFANREAAHILGYTPTEMAEMGESFFEKLIHPEDLPRATAHLARVLSTTDDTVWETEYRLRRSDGIFRIFHFRDSVFQRNATTGSVQRYLGVARDVTERRSAERAVDEQSKHVREFAVRVATQRDHLAQINRRLEALASTDGLTGLLNHRAFQDRLRDEFERAKRNGTPLSLLLIDVDYFKQYNDAFGHLAGDEVLKTVAQALGSSVRPTDIAARYGGEEFVAVLPGADKEKARGVAERICSAVADIRDPNRIVTVSIGATTLEADVTTTTALIGSADGALYHAKRAGRNCVRHDKDQCVEIVMPSL